MHCQVFTCPLQTTPSAPNDLVPREDSWGLTEGAPCISSDVCSRAAEGQRQTFVYFLFSLFLPFPPQVAIPVANSLGDTKERRQGTKPIYNPLQVSEALTRKSKQYLSRISELPRFRMALKFTSLHFWHLKSSEKLTKEKKRAVFHITYLPSSQYQQVKHCIIKPLLKNQPGFWGSILTKNI